MTMLQKVVNLATDLGITYIIILTVYTKLFLNLYLTKFFDTSAKLFFLYNVLLFKWIIDFRETSLFRLSFRTIYLGRPSRVNCANSLLHYRHSRRGLSKRAGVPCAGRFWIRRSRIRSSFDTKTTAGRSCIQLPRHCYAEYLAYERSTGRYR